MAKLDFEIKQKIIEIAGTCFWLWDNFYAFLENCGVNRDRYKRYEGATKYKIMRNVLTDLEDKGDEKTLKKIATELYRLKSIPDKNVPDPAKAKKVLQELKELCGEDLIEKEIESRKIEAKKTEYKIKSQESLNIKRKLENINQQFLCLFNETNHNKRGFDLEKIVYELFLHNEFEIHKPYKTNNEQIDGYFKFEKFDYLMEIKWVNGQIKQSDLAIFDKKVDKKALSTRGFFIAMDGFAHDAILSISGKEPRIILMDGEDLTLVFNQTISLKDAVYSKVESLVKEGNTHFKLKELFL